MKLPLHFLFTSIVASTAKEFQTEELDAEARKQETMDMQNVVGGTRAIPQEFPFFVQGLGCGGSLVTPDVVLTAAHCYRGIRDRVLVGAVNYNDNTTASTQWRDIRSDKVMHPIFQVNADRSDFDFMLFQIEPVTLPNIRTVVLNSNGNYPTTKDDLTVIGFGITGLNDPPSNHLMKATVRAYQAANCSRIYKDSYYNAASMMCAGATGAGACIGDSGGPLFDKNNVQVGVVSYGRARCTTALFPGVYAKVSGGISWIRETICKLSDSTDLPFPCPNVTCPVEATVFGHPSAVLPKATKLKAFNGNVVGNITQVPAPGTILAAGTTTLVRVSTTFQNSTLMGSCQWLVKVPPIVTIGRLSSNPSLPVGATSKRILMVLYGGRGRIYTMTVKLLLGKLQGTANAYVKVTLLKSDYTSYRTVTLTNGKSATVNYVNPVPFNYDRMYFVADVKASGITVSNRLGITIHGQLDDPFPISEL